MREDLLGLSVATCVIGSWAGGLAWCLATPVPPLLAPLAVAWQTFWTTGLFITAHDAMHGTVAPTRPAANRAVGALCTRLYAWFPFARLRRAHLAHHADPAGPGDPDVHPGGFARWYARFLWSYVTPWQILGMAVLFNLLHHGAGVPVERLLLFWVLPALLSTLQLFTVGTWLPHRPPHDADDPHRARSLDWPAPLSLLACYHFGYHREHHARPDVPWWRLPGVRAARPRTHRSRRPPRAPCRTRARPPAP